jgi:hypothetical protein
LGYDIFAPLTCDSLIHQEGDGPPNIQNMMNVSDEVIARINGIGRLIDPEFYTVSFYGLSYKSPGGEGGASPRGTTPNKQATSLGWHSSHARFADRAYELSKSEPAVRFILDAFAMRTTWVSLYLIYETIKDNVGGQRDLEAKGWITPQQMSDFRYSANHSRALTEGMRHATKIETLPKAPIPLHEAHTVIDRLAKCWIAAIS